MTAPLSLAVRTAGFATIKGTRHRPVDRLLLDADGAVGDRVYCLVDVEQGRLLRTTLNPTLVMVSAWLEGDVLHVALPTGECVFAVPRTTGEHVRCDYWGREVDLELVDGPHADVLSAWLGREVRLASAPRRGVVYAGAVTLVTTASLHELAERADHPVLLEEASRFRPTLVVETGGSPYEEDTWVGRDVNVGEARLRITSPIGRCAVIDIDPATGQRNSRLLKALAATRPGNAAREPFFGVNAEVLVPGEVTPGNGKSRDEPGLPGGAA